MTETANQKLYDRVDKALDTVRPHLKVDGGDVELVRITQDNTAVVKWLGNCKTCKMSIMTLRAGLEQAVKAHVPEIIAVEAMDEEPSQSV